MASGSARPPSTMTPAAGSDPSSGDRPRPPRKLNRSANQLHRNQACLPCRRRRIKCDAARPHCSSCVRSYRFLARTQPDPERDARGVQCQYEDSGDSGELSDNDVRAEEDPRTAVSKLEARIADLQTALARLTSPAGSSQQQQLYPQDQMSWMMDPMQQHGNQGFDGSSGFNSMRGSQDDSMAPGGQMGLHGMGLNEHHDAAGNILQSGMPVGDAMTGFVEMSMGGMGALPRGGLNTLPPSMPSQQPQQSQAQHPHQQQQQQQQQQQPGNSIPQRGGSFEALDHDPSGSGFNQLLWPDWPPRLPTLEVLDYLVQTFFTIVPSVSRILNRDSLIARLGLPPQHANFPHLALLHAICAITARYTAAVHTIPVEEVIFNTNEEMSGKRRKPNMSAEEMAASQRCYGERHAQFAQLEIRWSDLHGRRMLEVAQAAVIMSVYLQQHAKWIEGWMMVGTAVRLAIPMGLMSDDSGQIRPPNAIVEAPETDVEREERRLLIAYVMTLDFAFSAPSGWPVSILHDELWSRLPASKEQFDRGNSIPENPQSWWAERIYSDHPVVDSFLLYAKASHLLGSTLKYARKVQTVKDLASMRTGAMFSCIDKEISRFKNNIPAALQDPFRATGPNKSIDPDLINAHLLPHVMAIKHHEAFANLTDMRDESTLRVINEARAVLSMVCNLTNTALDLSYTLSPITSSRIFVQLYKSALQGGDICSAKVYLSEIDVFRLTFSSMSHRFALSARHLSMIDLQLSSAHAESGTSMSQIREGHDPLLNKSDWRRQMPDYSSQPMEWLFAQEPRREAQPQPHVPNQPAPVEVKNPISRPTNPLFLTPNTFIATQVEQQSLDVAATAANAARFIESPNSSPKHSSSSSRTDMSGNVLDSLQFPVYPPQQTAQEYEPQYLGFSDTQAAWLHSVAAATIPRSYGYEGA